MTLNIYCTYLVYLALPGGKGNLYISYMDSYEVLQHALWKKVRFMLKYAWNQNIESFGCGSIVGHWLNSMVSTVQGMISNNYLALKRLQKVTCFNAPSIYDWETFQELCKVGFLAVNQKEVRSQEMEPIKLYGPTLTHWIHLILLHLIHVMYHDYMNDCTCTTHKNQWPWMSSPFSWYSWNSAW